MALTYSIDPAGRVVRLTYESTPTFDEWAATMCAVFEDPAFAPGFGFLADRRAAPYPPTTDYIERVVAFLHEHEAQVRTCRWATVVPDTATYGMARMAQALGDDLPMALGVFKELEPALAWLASGTTGMATDGPSG